MSYAHMPHSTLGVDESNYWFDKLFNDLSDGVAHLVKLDEGVKPGFMDRRDLRVGDGWVRRLEEELATCRVFVPLYSPRYFHSIVSGQEWDAFASREVLDTPDSEGRTSGIVPVLWVPGPQSTMPKVARELQFNHADFGSEYIQEGIYGLMKLDYLRSSYERAVYWLAKRIVEVAQQTIVAPPKERADLLSRPSAFGEMVSERRLRIAVLACRSGEQPPGRSPDAYGSSPLDWQPYHHRHRGSGPLVHQADLLAKQLGFQSSIHEFQSEVQLVLEAEESAAPGLLLLDRWALLDPERKRLVKEFDERNPPWISVMEPWSVDDPDCLGASRAVQEAVEEALSHRHNDRRPTLRAAPGALPTLNSFEAELPRAAQRAMFGFKERLNGAAPGPVPPPAVVPSPGVPSSVPPPVRPTLPRGRGRPTLRPRPGESPPPGGT
jgi:FxsC-like protein